MARSGAQAGPGPASPLDCDRLGSPPDSESGKALPVSWVAVASARRRRPASELTRVTLSFSWTTRVDLGRASVVSGRLNQPAGPGRQPDSISDPSRPSQPVPCPRLGRRDHVSGSGRPGLAGVSPDSDL